MIMAWFLLISAAYNKKIDRGVPQLDFDSPKKSFFMHFD